MLKAHIWSVTVVDRLIRIFHPVARVTELVVYPSWWQWFNQQVGITHTRTFSRISRKALSASLASASMRLRSSTISAIGRKVSASLV
jgi:hypothetical protein